MLMTNLFEKLSRDNVVNYYKAHVFGSQTNCVVLTTYYLRNNSYVYKKNTWEYTLTLKAFRNIYVFRDN